MTWTLSSTEVPYAVKLCRFQNNFSNAQSVIKTISHGHVLHAYVNGVYAGKLLYLLSSFSHGISDGDARLLSFHFVLSTKISLCLFMYLINYGIIQQLWHLGSAHGNHKIPSFKMESSIYLRNGTNDVAFLSVTVGLPVIFSRSPLVSLEWLNNILMTDNRLSTVREILI